MNSFDTDSFFHALDGQRQTKKITWRKVAEETQVSASTLTRIAQGKRPDVDTLAALCTWLGMEANKFFSTQPNSQEKASTISQVITHLRADSNLSPEGAKAIETMVKTAYEQFRMK